MSQCYGDTSLATKIDERMQEFVLEESNRLGVSMAEFLRRLLEVYQSSRDGNTPCEHCGQTVQIELESV
jgi:negative regulator of replication initiation